MKWAIATGLFLFFGPLLMLAPILGMLVDPWAPFRLSGRTGEIATAPSDTLPVTAVDPHDLAPAHGFVSDSQRFLLARGAGFSFADAIIATAISIAENGSGDPAALSGVNFDGSRDLGMWQINSGWWPQFGGSAALVDPFTNARAAVVIYGRQGWCAWSTYGPCSAHKCGPPCYSSFIARATQASHVQLPEGQA